MASEQPFTPVSGSAIGKSFTINLASTNQGTFTSTTQAMATNVLVTNSSAVTLFVRMNSTETIPTGPIATSLDIPLLPNASRLFGNPNPVGATVVGVVATVTGGSATGLVIFTPGNQGEE